VRIVLDTNIIVAGLLSAKGPPGQLLSAWLDDEAFVLVTSQAQLAEINRVVTYEHLRPRISPESVADLLDNIDVTAVVLNALPKIERSPDPDDNLILATAIAGNANLIVSGDKAHVLALGQVEGISIITAREALARLDAEQQSEG
jgi:hypothetical protein